MADEPLEAFLKALKADPALQQRVNETDDTASVVAIASQAGFDISEQAWLEAPLRAISGGSGADDGFHINLL